MRNLVIVDVQTLFLASREEYGPLARVDYVKLRELFEDSTTDDVTKVAYVLASPYHDDKRFVRFLKKNGYAVIKKNAQITHSTDSADSADEVILKSRSWIDSMVWESVKMIPRYDSIYIVSGNGLFCSVANAAKQQNKKVNVISFRSCLQEHLASLADEVIYLDNNYLFDSNLVRLRNQELENVGTST